MVRNILIPLSDGVTVAADLHLPAGETQHPTLVSLYPYRKDDVIGSFAAYARHWFAERGYAHLLVDVRGYGGSEGHRAESFHPLLESKDVGEVVEWAAAQEWSNGAVGVWGVSYGGLTALAAGVARPAHLRAIAPVYPLWDVYADVAAPGGCPAMLGQHQWSTMMLAQALAPPTYRDDDDRWLRVWRDRIRRVEREGPEAAFWQAHPSEDDYWRERVLPIERIEVPTFLIGGWRDLFPESVSRAFGRIHAQKRLLVGPWLHVQPDLAACEPVDWLPMLLGFWDEHLAGEPPAPEPPVLVFVQGGDGGWRAGATWPPPEVDDVTLRPGPGGSLGDGRRDGIDEYAANPVVGTTAGQWDTQGTGMGYPLDQGPDDLLSLRYTSEPLEDRLEIAGSPEAVLHVERIDGSEPFDLVAKLVDVAPDGSAELITTGWTSCRGGPTVVRLWATAWALSPGHRLRLSVSCGDFPRVWPDPTDPRIRIDLGESTVRLPVARNGIGDEVEPTRPQSIGSAERFPWSIDSAQKWTTEHDVAHHGVAVALGGSETIRLPEGGRLTLHQQATARVEAGHPEAASVTGEAIIEVAFPGGEHVQVEARSRARRAHVLYHARVTVDGQQLLDRSWDNL